MTYCDNNVDDHYHGDDDKGKEKKYLPTVPRLFIIERKYKVLAPDNTSTQFSNSTRVLLKNKKKYVAYYFCLVCRRIQ